MMNKRRQRYNQPTKCRFCRSTAEAVDYKDIAGLQKLTTGHAKLFSRKRSGNCARHQRACREAIKRARFMALMPFVG